MKTKDRGLERTLRTYFSLGLLPQRKVGVSTPPKRAAYIDIGAMMSMKY